MYSAFRLRQPDAQGAIQLVDDGSIWDGLPRFVLVEHGALLVDRCGQLCLAHLLGQARRCSAILKSCDTVACLKVSPFSSSFAAFGHTECADLFPPAEIFLSVCTAPLRRAAFTTVALFAALPFGAVFVRKTGDQSCVVPAMAEGPLGIAAGPGRLARNKRAFETETCSSEFKWLEP